MKFEIEVPDYSPSDGLRLEWDHGFSITVQASASSTMIMANVEGLVSLARLLLTLAQPNVPVGVHIHLDQSNSLEGGSQELVIQRD
jgi:hypothetical protein